MNFWLKKREDRITARVAWFSKPLTIRIEPSAYNFTLYVPEVLPEKKETVQSCPKGMLSKYGRKLLEGGAYYYSRLSIANFVI